jgi:hypothetical protein
MAVGPGKYDPECTAVRLATRAETVILVVIGGDRGNGFSVQALAHDERESAMSVVKALRVMANEIEASFPDPPTPTR